MQRSLLGLITAILMSTPAVALEKTPRPFDGEATSEWSGGVPCPVSYYNICTGWGWCWSGFGDDFRIGLVVETWTPENGYALMQPSHFLCSPAPPSYGFTGTIAVHNVDAN